MDGERRPADEPDEARPDDGSTHPGPAWAPPAEPAPGPVPGATPGWSPFGPSTPRPAASGPAGAGPSTPRPFTAGPFTHPGSQPAPIGSPGAPTGPPWGAPTGGWGSPGAVAPGVGSPAQPYAVPVPTPPPARRTERRTLGLPPSLGLATAFMSFPAVGAFVYGLAFLVIGVAFSGSDSSDLGADLDAAGPALAALGAIVMIVGAIGLYGVVMVMAANTIGRTICTTFLVLGIVLLALQFALAPESAYGLVLAVPYYALCFWALWGRPGRSVF